MGGLAVRCSGAGRRSGRRRQFRRSRTRITAGSSASMPGEVRELLPEPAGGHALEAVHELGRCHLGREVRQQVHVVGFAVELGKLGLEVRAYRPDDLLRTGQVRCGEHRMPILGHEDQANMQDEDTVPAGAYVPVFERETEYTGRVQLRYNYRLYPGPGQRQALARAFGCARVVFNDALRARQDAHAAGLPYITDAELSARLTAAKASPQRAWLGEVSSVVLQQSLAGPERGVPELLRLRHGQTEGASGRAAPVPVPQGPQAGRPVHRQRPVQRPRGRQAAAPEDRGRAGALVPRPAL